MTIDEELPPWLDTYGGTEAMVAAVEDMLVPVRQLLDCFNDHLDPRLAPRPVLAWLSSCFGVDAGRHQRAVLTALAEIHGGWATRRGLTALVTAFAGETDATVEIVDNGGTWWAPSADASMPGGDSFILLIRITTTTPDAIDVRRLDELLSTAVPAHMQHQIEVVAPRPG
jgi:phage tail-like protein